ncbi:hypothetical protein [Vibrio superstes]|uniref:Uncharacterized protein n=1 Tax=Vibrio superstes NBRC 103154 TaxID=1219062 RepID=A0A511QLA1_9VIBR|nr:hypothetical protein [Vibrio superstes]GEM78099.1 hypothetical protein VSU01S_03440 [Vibrio superstes NBRC 103154]
MLRIAIVALLLVSPVSLSKGLVDVDYESRLNKQQQAIYELIIDSEVTEEFVEIVTVMLPFKQPIPLIYGNSTTEGHAQLLNEIEEEDVLADQQESCEETYRLLLDNWYSNSQQPETSV